MIKTYPCIVCAMSCHIQVEMDDQQHILRIEGNTCPRGEAYVRQEVICPMRTLTTTVRIYDAMHPLLPVITSKAIPKDQIFDIMNLCKNLTVQAPVQEHQILVQNIGGSGADLLASRSMERR